MAWRRTSASPQPCLPNWRPDSTRAAAAHLDGVLQALAWLSCQEECAVWAHVLSLDPEDLVDGIIQRLARSVSAAVDES